MISINTYSSRLKKNKHKIWILKGKKRLETAYPSDGHSSCFDIEDRSFWFQHRNNSIVSMVRNFPPQGLIFDIGGGNGCVAKALNNNELITALVEPSINGISNASTRKIPFLIQATLEEAKFYSNSLPAVGIFDVLEHMKDDVIFLQTIYKSLKPNGKLYLSVPAYNFLWSNQDVYAQHFRRYTLNNLNKILNRVGFKVVYSTYFFTILPLPILIFRSFPFRLKLYPEYTSTQFQKEMAPSFGMFTNCINFCLFLELKITRKKISIPFGSSILITAEKTNS